MFWNDDITKSINAQYKNIKVKDVGEKIGGIFGPVGKEIGEKIDNYTKNVTIIFGDKD